MKEDFILMYMFDEKVDFGNTAAGFWLFEQVLYIDTIDIYR